ncbi:MAG: hypothetical protein HYT12_04890 [Candidatus Liptonbacteria bacterium]|nr:hypothetical protein [Candidatus Liptonbacteria bacterium]
MELDRKTWYVRLFFWCLSINDAFTENNTEGYAEYHGTNLCHLTRVMLIYTPVILLLHAVLFGSAVAAITVIPVHLMGFSGYISTVGALVVVAALIYAAKRYRRRQRDNSLGEGLGNRMPYSPKEPSFLALVWRGLVTLKQQTICPLITFADKKEVS